MFIGFSGGLKAKESVSIIASKDNTIYDDASDHSNGAGFHLFTGTSNRMATKRALLYFDVKDALPANSVIDSAVLTLSIDKGQLFQPKPVTVYRLTKSWGEGGSVGKSGEGLGDSAHVGKATWTHNSWGIETWEIPGGDFDIDPSATAMVSGFDTVEWRGSRLVDDINLWLGDESKNHGWILIGEEGVAQTSKRYISKDAPETYYRPTLTLFYHEQQVSVKPLSGLAGHKLNAYPNPFLDELTVSLSLDKDETIQLGIYNLLGQQINQVAEGIHFPGNYQFTWDGTDRAGKSVPSGMYYIIFVKGVEKQVLKIMKSR